MTIANDYLTRLRQEARRTRRSYALALSDFITTGKPGEDWSQEAFEKTELGGNLRRLLDQAEAAVEAENMRLQGR
jgi:hypothetical protein